MWCLGLFFKIRKMNSKGIPSQFYIHYSSRKCQIYIFENTKKSQFCNSKDYLIFGKTDINILFILI